MVLGFSQHCGNIETCPIRQAFSAHIFPSIILTTLLNGCKNHSTNPPSSFPYGNFHFKNPLNKSFYWDTLSDGNPISSPLPSYPHTYFLVIIGDLSTPLSKSIHQSSPCLCGMFNIPKWVALFYPLSINHHLSISSLLWPLKSRFSPPTCCHCCHRHQATTAARGLVRRDPQRVGPAMDFHGTAAEGPPKAETMAARHIHEGFLGKL